MKKTTENVPFSVVFLGFSAKTRREGDSNPRSAESGQRFSRPPRSTTLPSLLQYNPQKKATKSRWISAEKEGFEPPEALTPQRFSRPPQSTTLPFLHCKSTKKSNPAIFSKKKAIHQSKNIGFKNPKNYGKNVNFH